MQNAQSLPGSSDGVPCCRNYRQMTVTEQGLVLGAGILLAKMGEDGLCLDGEEERILTLLAIAYRGDVPGAALGTLRRVSKHWQGGDKCLAAIHLAQSSFPEIGEDAATRLSLAAELIEAGMTPRELARELGLNPVPFDVSKYDENQPRVPAGSGRESGQWTSADAATDMSGAASAYIATHTEKEINRVPDLPKDAVAVTRTDGTAIEDRKSLTGKLMAPPNADFRKVYAAGVRSKPYDIAAMYGALGHFGTFDFQRDRGSNSFYAAYVHAANYAVGVYMAGAGYDKWTSVKIAETYGFFGSSNKYSIAGKEWIERGWDDAKQGAWQ
jgi:hypothetical protein